MTLAIEANLPITPEFAYDFGRKIVFPPEESLTVNTGTDRTPVSDGRLGYKTKHQEPFRDIGLDFAALCFSLVHGLFGPQKTICKRETLQGQRENRVQYL